MNNHKKIIFRQVTNLGYYPVFSVDVCGSLVQAVLHLKFIKITIKTERKGLFFHREDLQLGSIVCVRMTLYDPLRIISYILQSSV